MSLSSRFAQIAKKKSSGSDKKDRFEAFTSVCKADRLGDNVSQLLYEAYVMHN